MTSSADSASLTITNPCGRNWEAVLAIEIEREQQGFVNTPQTVLADWYHGTRQLKPIVFETNGVVVGMASWQPHTFVERTGWIANVMIDRRQQGKGHGRAAMEAMLAMFRDEGFEAVELAYHVENGRAALMYMSLGFRPIGLTPDSRQMVARLEF
jgi:diamine N-acetyltransferase